MNNSRISQFVVGGVASASLLVASSLLAGPGPQYWQASGKTNESAAAPVKVAVNAVPLCPGAQTVAVTTMKPTWPNGRGPLAPVQTGTRTVCYTCPVMNTVTTPAWSNGRGPATRVDVPQTGSAHDCGTGCGAVATK